MLCAFYIYIWRAIVQSLLGAVSCGAGRVSMSISSPNSAASARIVCAVSRYIGKSTADGEGALGAVCFSEADPTNAECGQHGLVARQYAKAAVNARRSKMLNFAGVHGFFQVLRCLIGKRSFFFKASLLFSTACSIGPTM